MRYSIYAVARKKERLTTKWIQDADVIDWSIDVKNVDLQIKINIKKHA